jgi:hypothetical protein
MKIFNTTVVTETNKQNPKIVHNGQGKNVGIPKRDPASELRICHPPSLVAIGTEINEAAGRLVYIENKSMPFLICEELEE